MKEPKLFTISPADNVAVALDGEWTGHKFALRAIAKGENVVKYGMVIGVASADIAPGEHVHTHNLKTALSEHCEYRYEPSPIPPPSVPVRHDTFLGYRRDSGEFGTRNDLWIVPTVGCVNSLARNLASEYLRRHPAENADSVGALALEHPFGCSQLGGDHERTATLLADFCRHPNAGGVLVVALGCENNTLESFRERVADVPARNIRFLRAQDESDEFERGLELLEELRSAALESKRESVPVSKLRVGLKCGGSDGFSGITANPLVGRFSDLLTAQGGTSVLTEVPEMFGAETLLMNRCVSEKVFCDCVAMIEKFKDYFVRHGQTVYENPSPGNKAGGISTLEDKSLGCTQKGGTSPVIGVHEYGDLIREGGLHLLEGPGNDMVAASVLAASGCQMILFTTGRGTPFGTVVPTLKIATNTPLAEKKSNWIDFDAGVLLNGVSMDSLAGRLFERVLDIASGRIQTCAELRSDREIAIFKDGVTL